MCTDIVYDETQTVDPDELFIDYLDLYLADELPF